MPTDASPPSGLIALSVRASFARVDRAAARALLATFVGPECDRVHRTLIALAGGDLGSLADVVKIARGAYRDVLAWEEFTGAGRLTSEPAREYMERQFALAGIAVPKGLR